MDAVYIALIGVFAVLTFLLVWVCSKAGGKLS